MASRLKRFGNGLMTCVGLVWFGYQALFGEGGLRFVSIALLLMGALVGVGAILDRVAPPPKRRRAGSDGEQEGTPSGGT